MVGRRGSTGSSASRRSTSGTGRIALAASRCVSSSQHAHYDHRHVVRLLRNPHELPQLPEYVLHDAVRGFTAALERVHQSLLAKGFLVEVHAVEQAVGIEQEHV